MTQPDNRELDREQAAPWTEQRIVELRSYHQPCDWSCAYKAAGAECKITRWLATLDAALSVRPSHDPA